MSPRSPPSTIGDSLQQALDSFFGFLPNLLGFLVILIIGYVVAKVVKGSWSRCSQQAPASTRRCTPATAVDTSRSSRPAPVRPT